MATNSTPGQAQAAEDVPAGTIKAEVLIPTAGPPYESPLDLRCPLHWTWDSTIGLHSVSFEEGSPESEAAEAARAEMWDNNIYPHQVRLSIITANGMTHYPELSPPFFMVMINEEVDWKNIHEHALQIIEKHYGKLEKCGYGRLPVRYIWREKYMEEIQDPW